MFQTPQVDGVLQLDAVAAELVHETFTCDTRDHEDHTFCGMMFDVECESDLPVEYVEVQSVSVRGDLGPLTVWQTPDTFHEKHESPEEWKKLYEAVHQPSRNEMVELRFTESIKLRPGERMGLYVHSALPGDEAIVYDNQRSRVTYQDKVFKVLPGLAHLSNKPFGKRGFWGRPWRMNREFVGRVLYGVRWKMWSPNKHLSFPLGFRRAVTTMMMGSRRPESLLYLLQDEIVLFIMNKCWWNWWGENMEELPAAAASSDVRRIAHDMRGGTVQPSVLPRPMFSGGGHSYSGGPYSGSPSSLYASLLGGLPGRQLASFTAASQLGAQSLSFDSESDDEYEEYAVEESADEDESEEESEEKEEAEEADEAEAAEGRSEEEQPLLAAAAEEAEASAAPAEAAEAEAAVASQAAKAADEEDLPPLPWKHADLGEASPHSVTEPLC